MSDAPERAPAPKFGKAVALIVALIVIVLAGVAVVVFPLLMAQSFESAEELTPENIKSFRVFVMNRKELDGGEDIGPYYAAEEDYATLLAPLKGVPEVPQFADARGPWLAEYRIQTKNGRKGTIKMYWVLPPGGRMPAGDAAKLRFQIGPHLFEGGRATSIVAVADECASRGRSAK
ncbi:hypothetical protein [Fimbriiglobus ruber]|uniref:Uncharacterized protein n=1 Tax=Fimbriiglobus ruber TaxID=1908690 RepID=A0A225DWJ8_9BACT|nr:hypothetical protein [Fimbriiglobus ruber]OWK43954.1 hypothetical protein FRUB_03553 [Fimbriiglobus ruber]